MITCKCGAKIGISRERLNKIISKIEKEFGVEDYELRGDNGDYTPNKNEKLLMNDMLQGFIHELADAILADEENILEVKN